MKTNRINTVFILLLSFMAIVLNSCQKENTGNGAILAFILHDGKPMPKATIYLQDNSVASPQFFDQKSITDVFGQVYFSNLIPGKYSLYCNGYDYDGKHYAEAIAEVEIKKRFRQNQEYIQMLATKY